MIVEERVVGVRVGVKLVTFSEAGQLFVQRLHRLRRDEAVLPRVKTKHRCLQRRQIRLDVGMAAIKYYAGADIGIILRSDQRDRASNP